MMKNSPQLDEIMAFLPCETPKAWCDAALNNQEIMLIDHAHCEKKAAATALHFMHRYPEREELVYRASRLAREELRHFEQVSGIMKQRGIAYKLLSPARYAAGLRSLVRTTPQGRLIDLLIIGAFIEARSCERFGAIAPLLDGELQKFYFGLLASEARHFKMYLELAELYSDEPIDERVALFFAKEKELIEAPDSEFRFHSGVPPTVTANYP